MRIIRVWVAAAMAAGVAAGAEELPRAEGPFAPTRASLKQYRCPEWFRDAKLGVWVHWGPQAVPGMGGGYARNMYVQGHTQYLHHVEHYGHPSTNGYKDLIPLWTADQFDPDKLMGLFKQAVARYFVTVAVHHDNFDLWNSKHQRWNAANLGPKRDLVGAWQAAAKKEGLPFGVSEHLGASFTWFQTSRGADATGALAGVAYDGADSRYEGLYPAAAEPGDTGWYTTNPRWPSTWHARIKDLVDTYHPDLLCTDGGVPFGDVGLGLIAHFYNADPRREGAAPQVVYACKQKAEGRWVEAGDVGAAPGITPEPWQTEASLGNWFYDADWKLGPLTWVIQMLADVVSKNGNLLLNVPLRPDGTPDPKAVTMLESLGQWLAANGEAIYGTRPWRIHGEGPARPTSGYLGGGIIYTARDIRFTEKPESAGLDGEQRIYAVAMDWPESRQLLIRALAEIRGRESNRIARVSLLGREGQLGWSQTEEGLFVTLPEQRPTEQAPALRISGRRLGPAPAVTRRDRIIPRPDGSVLLAPEDATLRGALRREMHGGALCIAGWNDPVDWVSWQHVMMPSGSYDVSARVASTNSLVGLALEVGGQTLTAVVPATGSLETFATVSLGRISIPNTGEQTVTCRAHRPEQWKTVHVGALTFKRAIRAEQGLP